MAALTGLRILDLTQYEAGPSCTQALALLGADVVKVETPAGGDPGRTVNGGYFQDSEYFMNWNSNKRSVAINLREQKGRDLLLKMAPHFDVFVENFGPGVVEKLDIGYYVIKEINPEVIYAQIKGFGLTGPYSGFKCFDMVAQAAAGALSITGEPDGPPMRPGPTLGDAGTGVQMALAISAAYAQKLREGTGQHIELSMQESVTYYMRTMIALGAQGGESVAPRLGNELDPTVNLFPSKPFGPNDYVYIMSVTEPHWILFCETIGHPDIATDPRFENPEARKEHGEELKAIITEWTSARTKKEAMHQLCEAGIPASAVFDTTDIFSDPHLTERGFVHHVSPGENQKRISMLGWPARMSESQVAMELAPSLGDNTTEILQTEIGMSPDAIQALVDDGIVLQRS